MKVRPISVTTTLSSEFGSSPEQLIVYTARVSSPQNQSSLDTGPKLLSYCIKNGHWSVFELVHWTVEIETSRMIAQQILRHELRLKNPAGNRQGSGDVIPQVSTLQRDVQYILEAAMNTYTGLIHNGVSPETARQILPLATTTRIYMCGSVRSWIHYFHQRASTFSTHAQKEHRQVANAILEHFGKQFPTVYEAITIKQ